MQVDLPWPPSALRPNASSPGNWRKKSTAAKKYRSDCLLLAKAEKPIPFPVDVSPEMTLYFYPPDKRRRDLDNMLASAKQAIDAVCEAVKIDDYRLSLIIRRCEAEKGGRVRVVVRAVF